MNIYETVTNRILNQLESGQLPWRKTWTAGLPKNLLSGKEYRGVNILVLSSAEFASRYWLTYRQAQQLGGYVRKGERATPVVYWKWRTPEDFRKLEEKTGKANLAPCVPFTSAVFNLEQIEGVPRPEDDFPSDTSERLAIADQLLTVMPDKPEIVHAVTSEPAYIPTLDRITLPHLSQFESAAEYYATLFHELTHSTGHPKRLNRFRNTEGDRFERYSLEELVAEFGATFLCAFTGISNPAGEALQASYIAGWAKAIRQDQRLILRAASAAQTAADYIRGKLPAKTAGSDSAPATVSAVASDGSILCEPVEPATARPQAAA
jgi:antirestriction protein ArdC